MQPTGTRIATLRSPRAARRREEDGSTLIRYRATFAEEDGVVVVHILGERSRSFCQSQLILDLRHLDRISDRVHVARRWESL